MSADFRYRVVKNVVRGDTSSAADRNEREETWNTGTPLKIRYLGMPETGPGSKSPGKQVAKKVVKKRKKIGRGKRKILEVELELPQGLSIRKTKLHIAHLRKGLKTVDRCLLTKRGRSESSSLETGFGEKARQLKLNQLKVYARIDRFQKMCDHVDMRILLSKLNFEVKKDMIKLDAMINRRYFVLLFELRKNVAL